MDKKIVVIGSSNIDLIMKMDRLPRVGETITDATFMQVYGGKGANQAVAASRAGGDVSFISCVGNDAYTPQMVKNFVSEGMNTQYVFTTKEMPSGHALVMIGSHGRNYLSVAPGANYALSTEHVDLAKNELLTADLILMQNEIPTETTSHVLDLANEAAIPVLWNFAPAKNIPLEFCTKVNTLIVNETEASYMAKVDVEDLESAKIALRKLLELGPKLVVLTLGAGGVLYSDGKIVSHCPAIAVNAVDTTAAGDVFCGSFAVARVEGESLKNSIQFAVAASALSVTKVGAQSSIPKRTEIDSFCTSKF